MDRQGTWMVTPGGLTDMAQLWDVSAPPGADPVFLRRGRLQGTFGSAMHPDGDWAAVADTVSVTLWPLSRTYPHVLRGSGQAYGLAFDS